jgi:hypothetical protein
METRVDCVDCVEVGGCIHVAMRTSAVSTLTEMRCRAVARLPLVSEQAFNAASHSLATGGVGDALKPKSHPLDPCVSLTC